MSLPVPVLALVPVVQPRVLMSAGPAGPADPDRR